MVNLLIDTNVLIHLLHPTSRAEAGLTRQLRDWDRAGYVRLMVASASGDEQGRSRRQLVNELEAIGLSPDRIVEVVDRSDDLLNEISLILGHRKAGDWYDALMVYTALNQRQQGHDMWLVTGDRNILRHADSFREIVGALQIYSLRAAVNTLKADFPLTIESKYNHVRENLC